MTPGALRQAMAARRIPWPTNPADLIPTLEAHADAHPGDPGATALLLTAELFRTATVELPQGYIRDSLVRFDAFSATWMAHDLRGEAVMIRAPRPTTTAVQLRLLERDLRAIQPLLPGSKLVEGALLAPALGSAQGRESVHPARVIGTAVDTFSAWSERGFGPVPPASEEIRVSATMPTQILCLTPGPRRFTAWLAPIIHRCLADGPPLANFLNGLLALPPKSPQDVVGRLQRAMAAELNEHRVQLHKRQLLLGSADRRARLVRAVKRLATTLPPPKGSCEVGFDLEGRTTEISSDGSTVLWGAQGELTPLYAERSFTAPHARRLLRALVNAPVHHPNPFRDNIGRWVSAGLKLRTVQLLLKHTE